MVHSSVNMNKRMKPPNSLVYVCLLLTLQNNVVESLVPSCALKFEHEKVYAAQAAFGTPVPSAVDEIEVNLLRPMGLQDGCHPQINPSISKKLKFALLVQRSPNCTFSQRAIAAQKVGASALVVQNSLEGIYRNRSYAENKVDYDCNNGESWTSSYKNVDEKYTGFQSSTCATNSKCASSRCLLTGEMDKTTSTHTQKICCAWDSYISMATSSIEHIVKIEIPSVFVKMTDVDIMTEVSPTFFTSNTSSIYVPISVYARYETWLDYSSLFLWLMGVFTAGYASWYSCESQRTKSQKHSYGLLNDNELKSLNGGSHADNDHHPEDDDEDMASLDLSAWHAIGFISVASVMLVILFFFDLYLAVSSSVCFVCVCFLFIKVFLFIHSHSNLSLSLSLYICIKCINIKGDCFVLYQCEHYHWNDYVPQPLYEVHGRTSSEKDHH
jgi:hypothetical protein